SDGGLPAGLPPLPGEVRYIPIGASSDNLALSALSLRPAASGPQLFASVANHGAADRDVIVSVNIDGDLLNAQSLHVPAGKSADLILSDLPKQPAIYQASLSPPPSVGQSAQTLDALSADDSAWAVYAPPTSGRVLLISPGDIFIEQVLAALPGLQPFRAPADAPIPSDPFDLYIFDGVITDTLPLQSLLIINPPPITNSQLPSLLNVTGVFTDTTDIKLADDPLLQFVDFADVHVLKAHSVEVPDWGRVLISSDGGPLLFAGETGGRRIAVLTFDLHDSDLPLQVAFPILISNLINWLSPAQILSAPDGLRPGQPIVIRPPAGATAVTVRTPGGTVFGAEPGEQGVVFGDTRELGLYGVTVSAGGRVQAANYFAVNLFDPLESEIRPRETITIGRSKISAAHKEEIGQREFWPWLAGAALALLGVEWWVYHHGATLPSRPSAPVGRSWFWRRKTEEV
ncbi:MAG: hypothetical protein HY023_05135, partial [Chloroflexi bacterium]|nr:hypothetical protein [Chloroflexota bacterium]